MQVGYKIIHSINSLDRFVVVTNYESENEVFMWGYISEDYARMEKTRSDVGMWKIKTVK